MNHTMHGIIFSYGKPTGLGDLIAQPRGLSVRKDDAVHGVVHAFTSP